jgi:prepilin peptidase CpaA
MKSIAWWPTVIVLAIAVLTDMRSRRIPNWLVFPFLLSGVAVSSWLFGWHGLGQSMLGIGVGSLLFGVIAFKGGMGMGDVKLCAAIGAWVGARQLVLALVLTGIVGGIMAVCWALVGGFLGALLSGSGDLIFGLKKRGLQPHPELVLSNPAARKLPYAPAIAIGTLLSFLAH